ncbi:unnamed protein product [Coccothraustes coccothraustes]
METDAGGHSQGLALPVAGNGRTQALRSRANLLPAGCGMPARQGRSGGVLGEDFPSQFVRAEKYIDKRRCNWKVTCRPQEELPLVRGPSTQSPAAALRDRALWQGQPSVAATAAAVSKPRVGGGIGSPRPRRSIKEVGRAGSAGGGALREEPNEWRGGGAEGGQPGCGKRGSALGLVPSQPFSVQPNSRFAEGANQGRTGGLCLAPANDW